MGRPTDGSRPERRSPIAPDASDQAENRGETTIAEGPLTDWDVALGRDRHAARRLGRGCGRPVGREVEPVRRRPVRRLDRSRKPAARGRAGARRLLDRRRPPGVGRAAAGSSTQREAVLILAWTDDEFRPGRERARGLPARSLSAAPARQWHGGCGRIRIVVSCADRATDPIGRERGAHRRPRPGRAAGPCRLSELRAPPSAIDPAAFQPISIPANAAATSDLPSRPSIPTLASAGRVDADTAFMTPGAEPERVVGRPTVRQPASVGGPGPEAAEVQADGVATFYHHGTTAMRLPRGTTVIICGGGGCIERASTTTARSPAPTGSWTSTPPTSSTSAAAHPGRHDTGHRVGLLTVAPGRPCPAATNAIVCECRLSRSVREAGMMSRA